MGIIIFVTLVAIIAILGYLLVYATKKPAIPPYQEPLVEKPSTELNPQAAWPFPTTKP